MMELLQINILDVISLQLSMMKILNTVKNSDKINVYLQRNLSKNIQKVFLLNLDDFEINEIDEDLYTESNFENISQNNSKKQSFKND